MSIVFHSFKMFSLTKIAYTICAEEERKFYNELETLNIDVKSCCVDVLKYLKFEGKCKCNDYIKAIV